MVCCVRSKRRRNQQERNEADRCASKAKRDSKCKQLRECKLERKNEMKNRRAMKQQRWGREQREGDGETSATSAIAQPWLRHCAPTKQTRKARANNQQTVRICSPARAPGLRAACVWLPLTYPWFPLPWPS